MTGPKPVDGCDADDDQYRSKNWIGQIKVVAGVKNRERHSDHIVSCKKQGTHDGKKFRAVVNRTVDSPTIGIQAAYRDVVDGDEARQCHHRREMPDAAVPGEGKSDAHHVSNAGTPISIKNGG